MWHLKRALMLSAPWSDAWWAFSWHLLPTKLKINNQIERCWEEQSRVRWMLTNWLLATYTVFDSKQA
jgi:hypothetical protein